METVTIKLSRDDAIRLRYLLRVKLSAFDKTGICPGEEKYAAALLRVEDAVTDAMNRE